MSTSAPKSIDQALLSRDKLTHQLKNDPFSIHLRMKRCEMYEFLGYLDLAVMDAYKALLLIEEVADGDSEYHEPALSSLREYFHSPDYNGRMEFSGSFQGLDVNAEENEEVSEDGDCARYVENVWRRRILLSLSANLSRIGCLRAAYNYACQVLLTNPDDSQSKELIRQIRLQVPLSSSNDKINDNDLRLDVAALPNQGYVRREVYPWNHHETERHSKDALNLLNHEMRQIAPKLEVLVTELPYLPVSDENAGLGPLGTNKQLGVFAKEDIGPGEEILREVSLLTGNSRLHEPLCDACSSSLPNLDEAQNSNGHGSKSLVPCGECDDVIFCSQNCHDMAQVQYHPAVCGMDVDAIAKGTAPSKAADSLYTLLWFRALAMAQTQNLHPLDLKEVKYIWGDFTPTPSSKSTYDQDIFSSAPRTLPFSFDDNILTPLHMLELMEVNIFDESHELSELWVWNTLFAKFRGTASARISPRDGRPEVAAVHPLWSLANHSCDPNVQWEWAGDIQFTTREKHMRWSRRTSRGTVADDRANLQGGIRRGEEVFSHYVDIELPVQDRREWGVGALGGICQCPRCLWESLVA